MLNELLSSVLNGAVGNNLNNDPNDVLSVKNGLSRAGYMDLDTTPEPHGYYTCDLDNGIKAFQRDNNLRIDGRLFPKGETERELFIPSRDAQTLEVRDYFDLDPYMYERRDRRNPDPGFTMPDLALSPFSLHDKIRDLYDNDPRDIQNLRDRLGRYGYLKKPQKMYPHTGVYDRETRDALQKFQQDLGIQIDGKMQPGGETEAGLNAVNAFHKLSNVNVSPEQSVAAINGIIGALRGGQSDGQRLSALTPAISTALGALGGSANASGALGGIANIASTALGIAQSVLNAKDAIKGDGDVLTKISQLVPAVTSGVSGITSAAKGLGLGGEGAEETASQLSAHTQKAQPQRGDEESVLVSYIQARQGDKAAQNSNTQGDVISGGASDDILHGQEGTNPLTTPPIPQRKPQPPTQSKVNHTIDTFLPKIFKDEGGYTDGKSSPNAIDPLGKTNLGIPRQTLVEYENFKKSKKEPLPSTYTKDVKKVSPKLAAQIYDEMYYKRYNIDKIQDENLAGHLLDITINPGPARAGRWLQEELNNHLGTNIKVDGIIGSGTIKQVEQAEKQGKITEINNAIAKKRYNFYQRKASDPRKSGFKNGWLKRADSYTLPPVPKRKPTN